MSDDIKRQVILSHYENPTNKLTNKKQINKTWIKSHKETPSCIDNLNLYLDIKKGVIKDIKFDGVACVISTSSTDIACDLLKNKKVSEAKNILNNYLNMIENKKFDKKLIKDLNYFSDVNKQLNRINCAKIGIEGILKALK